MIIIICRSHHSNSAQTTNVWNPGKTYMYYRVLKLIFFYVSFMGKAFKLLIYVWICTSEYFNKFFFWPGNFVGLLYGTHLYECIRLYVARRISIYLFKEESRLFCCYSNFKWFMSTKTQWREIFCLYLCKIKRKCLMLLLKIEF